MDPIQMQQTYLYWVNLPQFILNFKFKVVSFLLPHLLELKRYLNDQSNNQVVNPAVIVVALVIVLIVVKNIWNLLFEKRGTAEQTTESKELNNQVNDLKKQLKSLKTSFNQLTKQLNNKQLSSESQITHQKPQKSNQPSASDETLNNLLNLYNISLDQNKSLINYVLQSQCQVLKQLKKFKKLNKNSMSSSGRPSMSTVRSKTTQKKVQSKDKSPTKGVNLLLKSEIKKTEPKTVQKQEQKPLVPVLKQQKPQIPIKKQLKPQISIKKQVRIQVPTKNQITQQIPTKAIQEPITRTTEQQPKLQVKPPTFKAPTKGPGKVPVALQKTKVPSVPVRKVNQKLQKSTTIQQETKQEIVMPVTISPETPLVHNGIKVELNTVFKETKITEIVQQNNQIKSTKVQQFSSAEETKITTVEENVTLKDPNIEQNDQLKATSQELEQIIIVAPQKPPQLKKGIAPPGMKPGMKRTPPPPPTRK